MCEYVHICVDAHEGHKRAVNSLWLELQVIVSHSTWMLELNSHPQQEQQPPLQPKPIIFSRNKCSNPIKRQSLNSHLHRNTFLTLTQERVLYTREQRSKSNHKSPGGSLLLVVVRHLCEEGAHFSPQVSCCMVGSEAPL